MGPESAAEIAEALLDDELAPPARDALAARLRAEPESVAAVLAQLRELLTLRAALAPGDGRTADAVAAQLEHGRTTNRIRTADAVVGRLPRPRGGTARRGRPRRRASPAPLVATLAVVAVVALVALVAALRAPSPPVAVPAPRPIAQRAAPLPPLATVLAVDGQPVLRRGAAVRALAPGDALHPGDELELAAGDLALVPAGFAGRVALAAGSRLRCEARDGGLHLAFTHGGLSADLGREEATAVFGCGGAHGVARVVGTRFDWRVASDADRLEVHAGAVDLRHRRGEERLVIEAGWRGLAWADGRLEREALAPPTAPEPAGLVHTTLLREVEDLVAGGRPVPADGPTPRAFLEPEPTAGGGQLVALPRAGVPLVLELPPDHGARVAWLRWRDDDEADLGFALAVDGGEPLHVAGRRQKAMEWVRIALDPGARQLTITPLVDATPAKEWVDDHRRRPYSAVVRIDQVAVSTDPDYQP